MLLSTLLLAGALAAPAASPAASFPVPRAQAEFEAAVPHAAAFCQFVAGNVSAFQRAALPYAPLDLQVRNAKGDEADRLRNLWLAVAGTACSVDIDKLVNNFHCGERCIFSRRADLLRKLPVLRPLVSEFRAAKNVRVVAVWGHDEFRVNDFFRIHGRLLEARSSPVMGLVPSAAWKQWESTDAWAKAAGVDPARFGDLVQRLETLAIAAVVREGDTVRVIRIGLGDKESGLLFGPEKAPLPKIGQSLPDGRSYVAVEPIAPGVVFYETT